MSDDEPVGTVTSLLADLERGDRRALEQIFPIVYEELRLLARRQRRNWNGDTTMGTTALVHEAYLKLVDADAVAARTRVHFLRVASMAMRQILCNYARDQRAEKRGGDAIAVPFDVLLEGHPRVELSETQSETMSDLDDALKRLEGVDRRLASVVECRFFGGLSIDETAEALDISPATVKRDWNLARAWLFREMNPD